MMGSEPFLMTRLPLSVHFLGSVLLASAVLPGPLRAQGLSDLAGPWTGRIEVAGITLQ